MRQVAAALVSLGLVLGAVAALVPVSISVPSWEDGSCGPPVVRTFADATVDDPNEQVLIDRCEAVADDRMVVAALAVVAGLLSGLLALLAAWRHEAVVRRRKASRRQERAAAAGAAAPSGAAPQVSP